MAKAIINGVEINKFVVDGGGIKIPAGTRFAYSTWSEFPKPFEEYITTLTDWSNMFRECRKLTSLDVSNFDTSNVTTMTSMFNTCSGLTSLDLSSFNTSNVTDMSFMFNNCTKLTSLDLSNFDTSNVTKMSYMFYTCSGLTSLDLSSFNTSNVTDMTSMFERCSNIQSVQGILDVQKKTGSISASYFWGYSSNKSIRKITFRNLGYNSNNTGCNFTYAQNWGVNSTEILDARESLINTLITYSFDRASAGYSACTLRFSSNTKALFTEEEIAQMTSKGYTIA